MCPKSLSYHREEHSSRNRTHSELTFGTNHAYAKEMMHYIRWLENLKKK